MSDNPDERRFGPWIVGGLVLLIILVAEWLYLRAN
jgi:hypothetical protein